MSTTSRIDADTVKLQAIREDGTEQEIKARFGFFDARILAVIAAERIPTDRVVSVEHDDILFTGEAMSCTPNDDGSFVIYVHVKHILTELESLTSMRDRLLGLNCISPVIAHEMQS